MNIALAGYGFVGKAHYEVFKNHINLHIVDPAYNTKTISDIHDLQGVICCVGTPSREDGSCDTDQIFQVVNDTPKHVPILIKSTISLEGWEELKNSFPHHSLSFSPEFLRAAYAVKDLQNAEYFIIAGDDKEFWKKVFQRKNVDYKFYFYDPKEAIIAKYFRNSFLATKVSFFNQVFDFCKKLNIDYDDVREAISLDSRIGESHTFIDEYDRAWGGYCFPKDTSALLQTCKNLQIELSLLEEAVRYNSKIDNIKLE
jgi:UDPglucose 6-dehydrogenase